MFPNGLFKELWRGKNCLPKGLRNPGMTSGYGEASQCEVQNIVLSLLLKPLQKTIIKKKKTQNPGKESAKCFISCPLVMFCLSSKRSPGGYNWIYCPWNNKSCLKFYVFPLLPLPASKVGEERVQKGVFGEGKLLQSVTSCSDYSAPASQSFFVPIHSEPSPTGPPSPGGSGPPNPCRPCCHVCRDSHARVSERAEWWGGGRSEWMGVTERVTATLGLVRSRDVVT